MKTNEKLPVLFQGGMGVRVATPYLSNTVSRRGGLGFLSGVALERVMALELQNGDKNGRLRRALALFPFPDIAKIVLDTFFIEGGKDSGQAPNGIPVFTVEPSRLLIALTITANFAYVWLAKNGFGEAVKVGINYLTKIAMPQIYATLGAMMAGVDYIAMGAGIPIGMPDLINAIAEGKPLAYEIPVEGGNPHTMTFDPKAFFGSNLPAMRKPRFIAIVASHVLAQVLAKRLKGRIFGFVVEEPTAGGHNAPPRGHPLPNASGEPVYGERDNVDYSVMKDLGLPFWIGGSTASPERLVWALSVRATGIQVGTAFALCEESGMHHLWKNWIRELSFTGKLVIHTSSRVSPTGFPFKVAGVQGTLFDSGIYEQRERACQHGALVTLYRKPDGSIGYRCPSEPVESFVAKGGKAEDTVGRRCLCTGLLAGVGLADDQAAIITLGDDVNRLMQELMDHPKDTYNVDDVFRYLGL